MDLEARYQLLEKIGSGTYATVFRARDLDLGREVAVRQIHAQFLERPDQLERYWQEAQLLASLQHPNIVTIFDIHRDRGWVILELMQGDLKTRTAGRPMDLKSLRTTLAHCLRALKYLHAQGIVHGDIKPSNLMLDARRRVKIGDFGLARRASDSEGELVKGTTKYMAPETVSDEFGEFGPASDLYSLGFSAYELMCGDNFDSLFPGLSAFGSDQQIAWMMWHAAPDRRLPEISRVLEGVPDDLTRVIQKLSEKDPHKRYQSADAALADLDIDANLGGRSSVSRQGEDAEPAGDTEEPPPDKKRLFMVGAAMCVSVLMSLLILFQGGEENTVDKTPANQVMIVRNALPDENKLVCLDAETGAAEELPLGKKPVIYFRNEDKNILAREIESGDRIVVERKGQGDKSYLSLTVDRAQVSYGILTARDTQSSRVEITLEAGKERGQVSFRVPDRAKIRINSTKSKLVDLKEGDRVEVHHFPEVAGKAGLVVDELIALRDEELTGYVVGLSPDDPPVLEINFGLGASAARGVKLPIAKDCDFFVQSASGAREPGSIDDLKKNARIKAHYDVAIREITVTREGTTADGIIQDVTGTRMTVRRAEGPDLLLAYGDDCDITVNLVAATTGDLRKFDTVKVTYDETADPPVALSIDAKRPIKFDRLAILIANESFDDQRITPPENAVHDARMLREAFLDRYAYDDSRILQLIDQPRQAVLDQIAKLMKDVRAGSHLIVYVAGNAYRADDGNVMLAVKDTYLDKLTETGISLQQIAQAVEASPSTDKMILLDTCRDGIGSDLDRQPSTGEILDWLKPTVKQTFLVASCSKGEKGLEASDGRSGAFAECLARGFRGQADVDKDLHVTPQELKSHLTNCLPGETPAGKTQTPQFFLP